MLLPLMFHLRLQYFLNYAVNGCLIPFMSIYFQQMYLDNMQIGMVMGVWPAWRWCSRRCW